MNKPQLQKLLTIENPKKENVVGVIGRMEVLLDYFRGNTKCHRLVPFLMTYYLVTKAVAEKYITRKHYFSNIKDLEILDVYFASLYFKPLLDFLEDGKKEKPWETYFDYCMLPHSSPFLQILLGINAHINTDLYTSLVDLNYKNRKDYFRINILLAKVLPHVMKFLLISEHDFFGLGGILFKRFIINEFHRVIVGWRKDAWTNALLTNVRNKKTYFTTITNNTELLANDLIHVIEQAYRLYHLKNTIAKLNTLSVKL